MVKWRRGVVKHADIEIKCSIWSGLGLDGWMVGFFASPFYTSPKTRLYHINMDCHHQQPLKQKPTTKSDINWNRKK